MIKQFDMNDKPDLARYPSAEAQDCVPVKRVGVNSPRKRRRRGLVVRLAQALVALVLVCVVGLGALFWILSNRSVSNEQIRAQIESQLTALLGDDHKATIEDTSIAIGNGGLVAIDAKNVKFLRDDTINLGDAQKVAVKIEPIPLIGGEVVAKSISLTGATVAVGEFLKPNDEDVLRPVWPRSVDLEAALHSLGNNMALAAESLKQTGLENIELDNADLVGFEHLGLRSKTAKLVDFKITNERPTGDLISFEGLLETQFSTWNLAGSWEKDKAGFSLLTVSASGMKVSELFGSLSGERPLLNSSNEVTINMTMPFDAQGTPQQAVAGISIDDGALNLAGLPPFQSVSGNLNLRLLPQKNQIDIERSVFQIDGSPVKFVGGVRYPKLANDPISNQPAFRIEVEEFEAFGLVGEKDRPKGSLQFEGILDPLKQIIDLNSVSLTTPNGEIVGKLKLRLDEAQPHIGLEFSVASMPVEEFKQFWPALIAPRTRNWVAKNVSKGNVRDAWVKANFPPGVLGNNALYTAEILSASANLSGTTIKTAGQLPVLTKADGTVTTKGTETTVTLTRADASLGKFGRLKLGASSFAIGRHSPKAVPAVLNLDMTGPASAFARVLSLEPLSFGNKLDLKPADLSGSARAKVTANFTLAERLRLSKKPWSAELDVKNAASKTPYSGRRLSAANLKIKANPETALITGTAKLDGLPIKLALNQRLDGQTAAKRNITLTLDDKARRDMGLDTGTVLSGPIEVQLSDQADGTQLVTADLKRASLNFPWIGWSKGKGIPATAEFNLKQAKGIVAVNALKLRGNGFKANGDLSFDQKGLRRAKLRNVVLNSSDNFNLDLERKKNTYNIGVNARSYDGRALVRSFLSPGGNESKSTANVVVSAKVSKLLGFGGQSLSNVRIEFRQRGTKVSSAIVNAMAPGNAPTVFSLQPTDGGMRTEISTSNAGSVLRFLDLYTKIRGGTIQANLVRDNSNVFRGTVVATKFKLLDEPRLAQLFQNSSPTPDIRNSEEVVRELRSVNTKEVQVERLQATIEKGNKFLNIYRGRLSAGDASAAFDGRVYDQNNRMNVKGTFLPGRSLNRLVSHIPIIGLAFGKGKVSGLLGITFKLSGRYGNPKLKVNPFSVIAPGVFRRLFKF